MPRGTPTEGIADASGPQQDQSRILQQLVVGNVFETWKDLWNIIIDHGVALEQVIVSAKKDRKQLVAKCRMHTT